jgi:hypothetical protein
MPRDNSLAISLVVRPSDCRGAAEYNWVFCRVVGIDCKSVGWVGKEYARLLVVRQRVAATVDGIFMFVFLFGWLNVLMSNVFDGIVEESNQPL